MSETHRLSEIQNAILRNLLVETFRMYEDEAGLPLSQGQRPTEKGRPRKAITPRRGFGMADARDENTILRRLLATTAEAYEERLAAFRAEKGLVRHLLAASSDAVVTTDIAATLTTLNPKAEELTGWTGAEARGHDLADVLRMVDDQGNAVAVDLAPCFSQGNQVPLPEPLHLVHREGASHAVDGVAAAIREGRAGRILGAVLILRPVQER